MILNILFPNLDIPLDVLPAAVLMFSLLSLFLAYMILLSGKVTNAMIANIVGKMIIKRKAMGVWKFKVSTKSHLVEWLFAYPYYVIAINSIEHR